MMRMFCLMLSLSFMLMPIYIGLADEVPFFDSEKGYVFTEPHAHPDMECLTHCDAPSATGVSSPGSQTAPVITRSAPDAAGNVVYTIAYQSQGSLSLLLNDPNDYSWEDSCFFAIEDYRAFDYQTGKHFSPTDELITHNAELKKDTEMQQVLARLDVEVSWGQDTTTRQGDQWLYQLPATIHNVLTLTAPADYEDLILGLRIQGVSLDAYETMDYWDGNVNEWEFIRLSEYAAYETLQKGSRGDAVWALQQRLVELGYLSGGVDGDFGSGTERAVIAFQRAAGLQSTGIADDQTQKAMFAPGAPAA